MRPLQTPSGGLKETKLPGRVCARRESSVSNANSPIKKNRANFSVDSIIWFLVIYCQDCHKAWSEIKYLPVRRNQKPTRGARDYESVRLGQNSDSAGVSFSRSRRCIKVGFGGAVKKRFCTFLIATFMSQYTFPEVVTLRQCVTN